MPLYTYRAYNRAGHIVKGEVTASSEGAAKSIISKQGLATLSVAIAGRRAEKWWNREVFTVRKQKTVPLALFTRELESFLGAGLRLPEALTAIAESNSDAIGLFARDLHLEVESGARFSEALSRLNTKMPSSYLALVMAGEATGKLPDILKILSESLEQEDAFRAKIRSALVYPVILLMAALGAVFVAIFGVIPKLAPLIGDRESLSLPTRMLLAMSEVSLSAWVMILLAGIVAGLCFKSATKWYAFSRFFERRVSSAPVIGPLNRARYSAVYCRSLFPVSDHETYFLFCLRRISGSS